MGTKPDRQGKRKKKKKGDMEEMDAVRIGASRRIVANGTRKKWGEVMEIDTREEKNRLKDAGMETIG